MRQSLFTTLCFLLLSCSDGSTTKKVSSENSQKDYISQRLEGYATVRLTADLTKLNDSDRKAIPLIIQAAEIMDTLFWLQTYGAPDSLLNAVKNDKAKQFIRINYGPWDRLNSDTPFIAGVGKKPEGANYYPHDMTKNELEKSDVNDKLGQYSIIRRDSSGKLYSIPYHIVYKEPLQRTADLLNRAAAITTDAGFKQYLKLRANALTTDNYNPSDIAWMDMKSNMLDVIIGPIENYDDGLYNRRNAYEAYVLVKDTSWSNRLSKYVTMLPALQQGLPVDATYKREIPGSSSQLGAYDVLYYAGHCNSGSKTIAVNLPNDEELQKTKGTRRIQIKNAMQAKFDKILIPIAKELIDPSQISQVTFDAFFADVMFHEVAHGLGIKNTINGKGTVRTALQEQGSWLEEAKADILGLYMVTKLVEQGALQGPLENYYTTFMAGILRSVRFGAGEAHGKANMLAFNFFEDKGAFEKTSNGYYKVNYAKFQTAMNDLSNLILTLQGNGDKEGVSKLQREKALVNTALQKDLDKLQQKGIPVDIVFEQGIDVLGLK